MKKLTQFAVEYPVTILMAILGICILGYISYSRLGVDLLPDLNSPRLFVELVAEEKAPEEIEKQYIEQIESIESEMRDLASDKSDIYVVLKSKGYEPKTVRRIVALRRLDSQIRREQEALLSTYKAALGMGD